MKLRYQHVQDGEAVFELALSEGELEQVLRAGAISLAASETMSSDLQRACDDMLRRTIANLDEPHADASDSSAIQLSVRGQLTYIGIEAALPKGVDTSDRESVEKAVLDELVKANDVALDNNGVEEEFSHAYEGLVHGMRYQWYRTGSKEALDELLSEDGRARVRADVERNMKLEAILKEIVLTERLQVEPEDLETLALEIADREGTSIDVMKRFYGDDYSLLAEDALAQKAIRFVIDHAIVREDR